MTKIQKLKETWKKMRDAKSAKDVAFCKIASAYYETDEEKTACLCQKNIGSELEPLLVFFKCDSFNRNECCKNEKCNFAEQNKKFVVSHQELVKIRREFIKGLFSRTK